ncbi:MAG: hypothetical protein D6690_05680 [Nitrospirae bacterium]|nr:MAG: hypothetical protein D6690_05680 [Nitrospirota bacterium]
MASEARDLFPVRNKLDEAVLADFPADSSGALHTLRSVVSIVEGELSPIRGPSDCDDQKPWEKP